MEAGETVYFTLKATPFYAVSGGQVADEGTIGNDKFEIAVSGSDESTKWSESTQRYCAIWTSYSWSRSGC